jgi:hypothetical protein
LGFFDFIPVNRKSSWARLRKGSVAEPSRT